jgi:hypothetical protein
MGIFIGENCSDVCEGTVEGPEFEFSFEMRHDSGVVTNSTGRLCICYIRVRVKREKEVLGRNRALIFHISPLKNEAVPGCKQVHLEVAQVELGALITVLELGMCQCQTSKG